MWRDVPGEYVGVVDEFTALAQAAVVGEPGAFEAFIDASYGGVRRFRAALVDVEAADDLAQETYARCARALRRYRGEAPARAWLLAIARHVCMDELRSRTRRRQNAPPPHWSGPVPAAPDTAEVVAVTDLLERLEPDRRAAFALTQLLRMTYQEAAEVAGCPVGTIRSRVARARGDLIEMLTEPGSLPTARGSTQDGAVKP
jgi:RNA polymerase sigma-70 factor (ECF subfamily)